MTFPLFAAAVRLKQEFPVLFPRPRDAVHQRATHEYAELAAKIRHCLGEEFDNISVTRGASTGG